jgi:hypothetical protein
VNDAQLWYEQALLLDPDDADTHWNLAQLLLLTDQYERGWKEYEWRWKHPRFATAEGKFMAPRWQGEPLQGKRILIYAEQGFGDIIQFIRYASLISSSGAEVYAGVPRELERLIQSMPAIRKVVVEQTGVPAVDYHSPLLSVPRYLGTDFATIPSLVPYVRVDDRIIGEWKQRLGDRGGKPRVGVAWAGNKHHENDRNRTCPFAELAPLWEVEGMSFVSLHKDGGDRSGGSSAINAPLRCFDEELTDFTETAGLIECLDLVVTIDSAVAHLAGALGKPVWTVLPFAPDWRWGVSRSTTPWYPTMVLYRQPAPLAWESILTTIADDLRRWKRGASW